MFNLKSSAKCLLAISALGMFSVVAVADDASIRKNLKERFPNFPAIDEVSKTPIPGIFEVRVLSLIHI